MNNIFIHIQNKQWERYFAFNQSETGTLDFAGKIAFPNVSSFQEIESSHYFSPSWYAYLPETLQAEIHLLFTDAVDLSNADQYAFLTHIGAILLAVEENDGLLVAELLHRRTDIFFKFLSMTLYIVRPVATAALFSWIHGRFSETDGFQKMFAQQLKSPSKADTAEILFSAAYDDLKPKPGKESIDQMFVRYFQTHEHGEFTIGTVGSNFHFWDCGLNDLDNYLREAIGKDLLLGECKVRNAKTRFFGNLQISVQAEPYNPHDPNAIGISAEDVMGKLCGNGGKSKVGYIRATGASILRHAFPKKFAYPAKLARLGTNHYEGHSSKDGVVIRIAY